MIIISADMYRHSLKTYLFIALYFLPFGLIAEPLANSQQNDAYQQAVYQYLTFTPTITRPDGPIVIYVDQSGNLGYVAYGYGLAEVVRERYPDRPIRVIIKLSPHKYRRVADTFDFKEIGGQVKVVYIFDDRPVSQHTLLRKWLSEASVVVAAASQPAQFVSDEFFCVNVQQIGVLWEPAEPEEEKLAGLLENYRQLSQIEGVDGEPFRQGFFDATSRYSRFGVISNPDITNHTIPSLLVAKQSVQEGQRQFQKSVREIIQHIGHDGENMFGLQCGQIITGFSPLALGMLNRPSYSRLKNDLTKESGLFQDLLNQAPTIESFLDLYAGEQRHFYMAYMHNWLAMAEYLTTIHYLEPDAEPVILTNFDKWVAYNPAFRGILQAHGIAGLSWHNLESGDEANISFNDTDGRYLRIAKLPPIKNDRLYQSLFARSQNPVGVTGNQSLFMAIGLGKLPFYDVNIMAQVDVRSYLARFDQTGLLSGFFSQRVDPESKAKAVLQGGEAVELWSDRILKEKTITPVFEYYMDIVLNPTPELKKQLETIYFHETVPDLVPEDAISKDILKDVLLVRQLFKTMRQAGGSSGITLNIDWLRQEIQLIGSQLKNDNFRGWFQGFMGAL